MTKVRSSQNTWRNKANEKMRQFSGKGVDQVTYTPLRSLKASKGLDGFQNNFVQNGLILFTFSLRKK